MTAKTVSDLEDLKVLDKFDVGNLSTSRKADKSNCNGWHVMKAIVGIVVGGRSYGKKRE
jgi:hypothetical protein